MTKLWHKILIMRTQYARNPYFILTDDWVELSKLHLVIEFKFGFYLRSSDWECRFN